MGTVKEVLIQAREVIADPECWATGSLAYTANGIQCSGAAPEACKWCALGAVEHVTGDVWWANDGTEALNECARTLGADDDNEGGLEPAAYINDTTDHATVLRMYDCAIAKADA